LFARVTRVEQDEDRSVFVDSVDIAMRRVVVEVEIDPLLAVIGSSQLQKVFNTRARRHATPKAAPPTRFFLL
jgi:hypothetical protein